MADRIYGGGSQEPDGDLARSSSWTDDMVPDSVGEVIFDVTKQTRVEFERLYQEEMSDHGCPPNAFDTGRMVAMRCSCEESGGKWHWIAVIADPDCIDVHMDNERDLAGARGDEFEPLVVKGVADP